MSFEPDQVRAAMRDYNALREENRRLRELVQDMHRFIHAACEKYPRMFDPNLGAGGQMVREMPDVRYASEMRELGVEVDV